MRMEGCVVDNEKTDDTFVGRGQFVGGRAADVLHARCGPKWLAVSEGGSMPLKLRRRVRRHRRRLLGVA